ncbi:unnamed protein product, partial [Ascophyllum nodosum]
MVEGDEDVVLLEEGPFRLTASCQTINYTYSDWDDVYYYSSYSYSTYVSSTYLGSNSTSSPRYSSDSTSTFSYGFDDDFYYYYSDDY